MRGFYGILLIVALVVISGLIAYIGDLVGRRMGRKRLSLFGLRPRHTAIAVSVAAGMSITLFTLAAAMAVSRDVKDGFLRVGAMRRDQARLSEQVKALSSRIAHLDGVRKNLEQQLASEKADLAAGHVKLEETRKALKRTEADLQGRKGELVKVRSELAKTTEVVRRSEQAFKRTVARQTQIQDELQKRIDALRLTVSRAEREYVLERALPILFGAGQPLDVELMSGGQPVAQAVRQLSRVVARLNAQVVAAGARPAPGSDDAVIIHKPVRDAKTNRVTIARSHQVLEAVASRVHESSGDVIVRAFSVLNTHAGEPVYVDFELFRNLLVFRRGEVLAETVIDGQLSEPALMGLLVRLLRDEVGARARDKNVMPRLSPDGSNLFGSSSEKVGEMTYEDLFLVIERLRHARGPARVTAVAAEDTWTIGPLKVDLRVQPVTLAASE